MEIRAQEIEGLNLSALDSDLFKEDRKQLIKVIRRWGGSSSDAILDPACKLFRLSHIEGVIGYRTELGSAIVFGDPICSIHDRKELVEAFHHYCNQQELTVTYITVSESFVTWALQSVCKTCIEFGEEIFIDPYQDPRERTGIYGSLVRRKTKNALQKGVEICEYNFLSSSIEEAIDQVGRSWLKSRRGLQIYTSHVRLFDDRQGKRWFYAKQNDRIIGTLILHRLETHKGWLLNHVMVIPDAPQGTSELLVVLTLEALKKEECHFVTFGAVPSSQIGEIVGLSRISTWIAKQSFKIVNRIFHLDGRKKFWEKFQPQYEPSFLLMSKSSIGLREIVGLMRALNVSF